MAVEAKRRFNTCHVVYICLAYCIFLINFLDAFGLGKHSRPTRGATVLPGTFPDPKVFYKHFVGKGEPLLMKEVLPDSGHKAFGDWDDDYLREHFGNDFIHVEHGKKEDRSKDVSSMKFWKFLDVYLDIDLYMVYSVSPEMQDDVEVPFTLQCGGFQDNLHDAVIWFSGGNTKSVLHYDAADNIICSLDGMKQVVLIDKKYEAEVKANGFVEEGAYSLVDVDNVDAEKFPQLATVPWVQVNITKGDCLFIPYKWFHHVYSPPGRNLAVNMWFSHLWWFNETDCEGINRSTPFKPMSKFLLASPNEQLRTEVLEPFKDMDEVHHDDFVQDWGCEDEQDTEKIWTLIDIDRDNSLTWPEMYQFNMDDLVSQFPQCFLKPAQLEDTVDEDEDIEEESVNDSEEEEAEKAKKKLDELHDELNTVVKEALEESDRIDRENQFIIDNIDEKMFENFDLESNFEEEWKDKSADKETTDKSSTQPTTDDKTTRAEKPKESSKPTTEELKITKKEKTAHDEF